MGDWIHSAVVQFRCRHHEEQRDAESDGDGDCAEHRESGPSRWERDEEKQRRRSEVRRERSDEDAADGAQGDDDDIESEYQPPAVQLRP